MRIAQISTVDGPVNQTRPLVDRRSVEYVGYVSGTERDQPRGGARALLYPIQVKEPFGLVQVEAMMCGTPVAAMRLGALPEIVDEGVTGFCVYLQVYKDLISRRAAVSETRRRS